MLRYRAAKKRPYAPRPTARIWGDHSKIFCTKTQEKKMDRMNLVQAKNIEGRDKPIWLRRGSVFMEAGTIKGIKL